MQRKENNEPPCLKEDDRFYNYFRDSLQDHQLSVDEECWENILERTNERKSRLVLYRTLYTAIAASILIFLVGVKPHTIKEMHPIVSNMLNAAEHSFQRVNRISSTPQEVYTQKERTKICKSTSSTKVKESEAIANQLAETEQGQPMDEKIAADEKTTQYTAETTGYSSSKKRNTNNLNLYDSIYNQLFDDKPHKRDEWKLSSTIDALALASAPQGEEMTLSKAPCFSDTACVFLPDSAPISDIKYSFPISVGLLVRKNIGRKLSIETGLVYTYLSTSYKDKERQLYSAKLSLHYVGVPINMSFNVWNIAPRWNMYASAGVMIEKGITSNFSQYTFHSQQTTTHSESISGFQYSINALVGFSYKVHPNWSLYLEPRISHYFDNGQPLSIRTEKQTIVGGNTGLRYEF